MKIKVFYLINSLTLGGAERQMAELVRRLPRDRFEPVLCLLDGTNAYRDLLPPDQPRHVIGSPVGFRRAVRLARILREEDPDIVHSFMEYSNLWARTVAPLAHGRSVVVTSVRSRMMRPDYRLVEALLARNCHAISVNSVGTRDELVRWQRVPAHKIHVVRNILNLERFQPATPAFRHEAKRRFATRGVVFVTPGRISVAKYQIGLCAAVALAIRRQWVRRDAFTVLLAGRVYDTSVQLLLSAAIRGLDLSDVIRYVGTARDVEALYAAADYVLLPSLYEGLPNAAIEAHACSVPLLMSHSANLDRIMEPGRSGFEFPTGRIEPMARTLVQAVETAEEERQRLGETGRRRVLRMFDPDAALEDTVRLYEHLLLVRGRKP